MRAQPQRIQASQQRVLSAFDVEIGRMLAHLQTLALGRTADVYLTPMCLLYTRQHKGAKLVGTYDADVARADFWGDCQWLAQREGWVARPAPRQAACATASN